MQLQKFCSNPKDVSLKIWAGCLCRYAEITETGGITRKNKKESEKDTESTLPIDSLEMFENIAFLMHKHGDPNQPSEIDDWLEQFETFSIYEVLPDILEMWGLENKQMSTAKKKTEK
jgi:hypothetical protein